MSALSLSEGALSPLFDADVISYSAEVAHNTERITVDAVANDSGASVVVSPVDADPDTAGHQVDVAAVVSVRVTASDGVAFRVYTVTVSRPAPPPIRSDFGFRGVLGADSGLIGSQPLVGFSIRGGGLGSFTVTEVDDPERAPYVGSHGFFTGLFRLPGTYRLATIGEFTDAVAWMTGRVGTPFELVVDGRRYGSGSASASNAPGTSDRFWVWEDPCASWADGAEVDVSYAVGVDSGAVLGSADASLAVLSVDGAVLGEGFAPATLDYSATAETGVSQVTVTATATDPNACSVAVSPADADPDTDGHQVDLAVGEATVTVTVTAADADAGTEGHQVDLVVGKTTVTVTVTAADSTATRVYTVTVRRPPPPPMEEITFELPEHCTLYSHGGGGWIPTKYWDRRNAPDFCHKRHPHYRSPQTDQVAYGAHFYRLVVEEPGEVRTKIDSRWTRSVLAVWSASGELVASDGRGMNHRHDPDMRLTLERGQYVVEVGTAIINIGDER